ncbi:hypothetical protein [Geobacillus sp. LEMMY01]|uniref:hypothetical protein n=1 Tax=Geobacillus sp. LEMMY01 TaxID=1954237 RepID=UPI00159107B1|nr:hypothetical protein [Geobacillus sp. LEMMY01]
MQKVDGTLLKKAGEAFFFYVDVEIKECVDHHKVLSRLTRFDLCANERWEKFKKDV